jgi:acyl carrier protein
MATKEKKELALEVTQLIIEKLNIEDINAEDIDISAPLFGDDNQLELDSIDTIEIVVELQKAYGVRINDELPVREILFSIETITDFLIKENATEKIIN